MIAITRDVSPSVSECELTHLERRPVDYGRAAAQHEVYRRVLRQLGCEVVSLPADASHPDCVFVEDTAIVLDEVAVITRPGAESRRGETAVVAEALAAHRPLARVEGDGATIDGGDVLVLDRTIYAGRSARTSEAGIEALRAIVEPHGYRVVAATVDGCLHLKSAVTRVSPDSLLVNRAWIDPRQFDGWALLDVDSSEPFAANALLLADTVVFPSAWVKTRAKLEARGIHVVPVDADELAKAEGGVTCCSLLVTDGH